MVNLMVGCPICGEEVTSKPFKTWKYGNRSVERYECNKCSKKFNLYMTKSKSYTIPRTK